MERPVPVLTMLIAVGLALPGCPIYDDGGCDSDSQCAPGYACQRASGDCKRAEPECDEPDDCQAGATCDRNGACRSVDCSWAEVGCVDGYQCVSDDGLWHCLAEGDSSGGSSAGQNSGAGASQAGALGAEQPGAAGAFSGAGGA